MTPATADFASLPPPLPRRRFTLTPPALIVLGLCAAIHLLAIALRLRGSSSLLAVQDAGIFALGFLLSIGFATLAWRLDPRRQAGNWVFCCLMLLFALGRVPEAVALASGPSHRPAVGADAQPASLKVRAVTDRVMHGFQEKMEAYNRASADLKAAGMIDATGLDSREAIARRRALVKSYGEANDAFTEACRTLEPTLHAALVQAVPEAQAQQGTAAVMVGFDMPLVLRMRDCERRATLLLDGVLNIYDAEFPRWHVNAEHRVVFDDPAAVAREHRWGQQLQAVTNEERALQREKEARKAARLAATTTSSGSAPGSNPAPATARRE